MPDQIIPKSIATPGLLAHILTAKFADALPFYRQEKQFARIGIELARSTMCKWGMKVADVLFEYHPTRSGDVVSSFLNGYKGIVQTDGYAGYDFLDTRKNIVHVGCLIHARRKFKEVTKALGNKANSSGNAGTALLYISNLYKIEKEAWEQGLSPAQLYDLRQSRAVPILTEFKKWLDVRVEKIPPKSLLGKAINFTLSQWHRLIQYATEGIIRPDIWLKMPSGLLSSVVKTGCFLILFKAQRSVRSFTA